MKKLLFAVIISLLVYTQSFSQDLVRDSLLNTYKKEFYVSLANFAVGGFELGYGTIKGNRGAKLFLGYYSSSTPDFYDRDGDSRAPNATNYENMEGFRAEGQLVYTKAVTNRRRIYGGGYGLFKTISMDVIKPNLGVNGEGIKYTANGTSAGAGIIGGVKYYVFDNFFMDLYFGGGFIVPISGSNIDDVHLDIRNPYKRSVNPRGGITFGLAF